MNAQKLWDLYSESENISASYEEWAFGDAPDELARLVLSGVKTATSSAYPLYELSGEDIPKAGEYSVILDSQGSAVCIIKTTKVSIIPFNAVSASHAYLEGEDDRSLACWRKVHEDFFTAEMTRAGLIFDERMPVVCEEFEKVYPL